MNLLTATRLQELRKRNGYSQEVLAEKIGVSRQSISKWERAESSPEIDNLMALAQIYGMTVDELLNTDKDKSVVVTKQKKPRDIKGKLKSLLSKANDFGIYPQLAKKLLLFPYPLIVTAVYIALSAVSHLWHPLWILFLTIPVYYRTAIACKGNSKKALALLLPIPEVIVIAYLLIGLLFNGWSIGAFLFILIPIYYWIAVVAKENRE